MKERIFKVQWCNNVQAKKGNKIEIDKLFGFYKLENFYKLK